MCTNSISVAECNTVNDQEICCRLDLFRGKNSLNV